jgi:hypothetical protein
MDRETQRSVAGQLHPFLDRCTGGHDVLEAVAAGHSIPAYLVGLLSTAFLRAERWPVTEAMLRQATGSATSRFGAEHWSLLVATGFAANSGPGWVLTSSGLACVFEFHRAAREEVARRSAPPGLVSIVRTGLAPMAELIPPSTKIHAIRRLWNGPGGKNEMVDLYRTVWELWTYRQSATAATDDVYFAHWPTGASLYALSRSFDELMRELR